MTIDSLNPTFGAPGTLIAILGSGLDEAALVSFGGLGRVTAIAPSYISESELRVTLPAFDGEGGTVQVSALTGETGAEGSNAAEFTVTAWPAVATVYPLCSLKTLKTALGVTPGETVNDAQLQMFIDGASAAITRESRLDFRPVAIVNELGDGDGTPLYTPRRGPIVSVQGLRLAGATIDPAEVKVYEGWLRFEETDEYNPRLRASSRVFPRGNKNVALDYTVGFTAVPYDVMMAAVEQAIFIQNTIGRAGVSAETSTQSANATTYAGVALAPSVMRTINRYRVVKVGVV